MILNSDKTTFGQLNLNSFIPEEIKTFEPLKTTREQRGKAIAESAFNNVKRFDDNNYAVKAQSKEGYYVITKMRAITRQLTPIPITHRLNRTLKRRRLKYQRRLVKLWKDERRKYPKKKRKNYYERKRRRLENL